MEKYILGIGITVYNKSGYIQSLLVNIINQIKNSSKNVRLIIYDDKSTDDSIAIINDVLINIGCNDIEFYISEINRGAGKSKNLIIEELSTNCKYLTLIDGDDNVVPNYLKSVLESCNNNYDMIQVPTLIDANEKYYRTLNKLEYKSIKYLYENGVLTFTGADKIIKTDLIRKIQLKFDEKNSFDDIDYSLRAYQHTIKNFHFIDGPHLYIYNQKALGRVSSQDNFDKKIQDCVFLINKYYKKYDIYFIFILVRLLVGLMFISRRIFGKEFGMKLRLKLILNILISCKVNKKHLIYCLGLFSPKILLHFK